MIKFGWAVFTCTALSLNFWTFPAVQNVVLYQMSSGYVAGWSAS